MVQPMELVVKVKCMSTIKEDKYKYVIGRLVYVCISLSLVKDPSRS